jgi:translation initiation factor IF-3
MTFEPWTQWPAQEPPPAFTDRMVGRLLAAPAPMRAPMRARRRWIAALAVAAALVATTAWAVIRYARSPVAPRPAPLPQPALAVDSSPPSVLPAGPTEPARLAEPHPEAASAPAAQPRPPAPAPSAVPAVSASTRRVVVPRCECGPGSFICTCVE